MQCVFIKWSLEATENESDFFFSQILTNARLLHPSVTSMPTVRTPSARFVVPANLDLLAMEKLATVYVRMFIFFNA